MGILVDPEADHDTERNGELLKGDKSTSDLTVMTVSKVVMSNQGFGVVLTAVRTRSCTEARSWTDYRHPYHCHIVRPLR